MWSVTISRAIVSKRSKKSERRPDSLIEPSGRPRAIVLVAGSARILWSARIDRNTTESLLDDATDEDLVRAIQRERAPQAHGYFMILYRRYADRMYQKCLAYSGNEPDARDLTQEVFIKIYTGLSSFRFQSSVSTWVQRVAINHCLNFLRARKSFVSFDEVEAEVSQSKPNDMDLQLDLSESLRRLPGATRSLLLLKYVESYTYEEIAELTGLSVSAVKMRISRARQSLARETQE